MKQATRRRPAPWALAAVLVLAMVLVLAAPAKAAPEDMQATRDQLALLTRAHIQYEWLPDIQANQTAVQTLLDHYLACTEAERAAFTEAERTDLQGYFTALYQVQGKDPADAAALLAPGGAASSGVSSSLPSSVASGAGAGDAAADPSAGTSAAGSGALGVPDASLSTPAASGSAVIPVPSNPPQSPGQEGWLGLFGNGGLGSLVLVVLVVLAALLFIRFMVALRRAGKVNPARQDAGAQAQELFGESFDPALLQKDTPPDDALPGLEAVTAPPAPKAAPQQEPPRPPAPPAAQVGGQPTAAPAPAARSIFEPPVPADEAAPPRRGWFGKRKDGTLLIEEAEPPTRPATLPTPPPAPAQTPPATVEALAPKKPDAGEREWLEEALHERQDAAPPTARPGAAADKPRGKKPAGRTPPGLPNSISMRSFSAGSGSRTGRPPKMPFRQGDPEDLDAIDE